MTPLTELRRSRGTLALASKILMGAFLLELPFLVVIAARFMEFNWTLPKHVDSFLWAFSSLLAIIGYNMVSKQLSLWEEAMEESNIPELISKTRMLGSTKATLDVLLTFYMAFLLPLFNLPIILWARSRARTGVESYDMLLEKKRRTVPTQAPA